MTLIKKVILNIRYILKHATKATGAIFALLGFVSTFVSLNEIIDPSIPVFTRILYSMLLLFIIWAIFMIICSLNVVLKKCYKLFDAGNGHHIYVQYGDIFSPNVIAKPKNKRNIVIPVNRCFDTIVDDDLISSTTLHGITMKRLYDKKVYNENSLNDAIQKQLDLQNRIFQKLTKNEKRKGNLSRYPAGTVVEINENNSTKYFFLGLSSFNQNLHPITSAEDYVQAMIYLIKFCNERSQGFPVILPLIGGGASDTTFDENDILRYIVELLKLNHNLINCDIHIVVRKTGKKSIPITNI